MSDVFTLLIQNLFFLFGYKLKANVLFCFHIVRKRGFLCFAQNALAMYMVLSVLFTLTSSSAVVLCSWCIMIYKPCEDIRLYKKGSRQIFTYIYIIYNVYIILIDNTAHNSQKCAIFKPYLGRKIFCFVTH